MSDRLSLTVNGAPQETQATTLAELCKALGYADIRVATAINGLFIPQDQRAATGLNSADEIEILTPRAGG